MNPAVLACALRAVAALLLACVLVACGSGGSTAATAPVAATTAPSITLAPGGRAASAGATVSFSVSAIGTPTRYQWQRDGRAITGATAASYSLTVALADDGARFSVLVGNDVGEATSSEALLTVYPAPPSLATCQAGTDVSFALTPSAAGKIGVDAGAVVGGCKGPLRSVVWTQTGGPPVVLLSDKTPAISFVPAAAGTYTFHADYVDAVGTAGANDVSIPVAANADAARVAVRADQAVLQGGNVSLRAWPTLPNGDAVQSLTWRQVAGPPVVLDTRDPARALFTAPAVGASTALVFTVTLRTQAGLTASDEAFVLVEGKAQAPDNGDFVFAGAHVSRVYAYEPAGPYAAVLQRCVYDPQLQWRGAGKNACTLATLPFLGQDTAGNEPTVAQIMDRVVVSHDWMGQVFEQFIGGAEKADLRRLLNGVTAIVIGAHVRPSFYFGLTGAIYLDADNFWLTPEQRDVIDETPDFRADFDRDLAFSSPWRYVVNGQNIFLFFPPDARLPRTVDYLLFESAWLLYHELGHAGDFLPPALRPSLVSTQTVWDNFGPRFDAGQLPSDVLAQQLPLTSSVMRGLAQVAFNGATADPTQRSYAPLQVAEFFRADRATDEYAYTTVREDIALLFEEFMMARNHGIRRDFAITDKIMPATTGNSLIVRWGERGRVGATAIKPRAKLAVQNIAPWIDAAAVDALPLPLAMRTGESWNANLALPATPQVARVQSGADPRGGAADRWLLERAQRRR